MADTEQDDAVSSSSDENEEESPLLGHISKCSEISKQKERREMYESPYTPAYQVESRNRSALLSLSLCFTLLAFWLLDSLKDPVFATLVEGDLKRHQPLAKMISVASTLALVCLVEIASHEHAAQQNHQWKRQKGEKEYKSQPSIPASLIWHIGIPYCVLFTLVAFCIGKNPYFSPKVGDDSSNSTANDESENPTWKTLGYFLYLSIESYGSISVAAFWAFANASLDLESAKRNYGLIIAVAQIGAIIGATAATAAGTVPGGVPSLFILAVAAIVVNMLIMKVYDVLYPFPLRFDGANSSISPSVSSSSEKSLETESRGKIFMSGVHLILRHNYLLLILGVSCLYEVALTCIDYEMKLVGLAKFQLRSPIMETAKATSDASIGEGFTRFIGRYGQLTNGLSLLLSFFGFPFLMRNFGLRLTLRVFPTLLVIATLLAFTLPNLWVLFVCMAMLKAMTYSINDPAKEILYMPTSTTVKFKAKFWIDIVGARFAKALGSSITNYAGSADRLVKVGSIPSVVTSVLLLVVSVSAGREFDYLVEHGKIVGLEEESELCGENDLADSIQYKLLPPKEDDCSIDSDEPRDFWSTANNRNDGNSGMPPTSPTNARISSDWDENSMESGWESNTTIELVAVKHY